MKYQTQPWQLKAENKYWTDVPDSPCSPHRLSEEKLVSLRRVFGLKVEWVSGIENELVTPTHSIPLSLFPILPLAQPADN